jgi:hypothetical protein
MHMSKAQIASVPKLPRLICDSSCEAYIVIRCFSNVIKVMWQTTSDFWKVAIQLWKF